jgi:spore coat protein U-like protein
MKIKLVQLCVGLLLLGLSSAAPAFTCSITSPGFTVNYEGGTTRSVQTYFTMTCERFSGDPASLSYDVAAGSGNNASGQSNRAAQAAGGPYVSYDLYKDSGCTAPWKVGGLRIKPPTMTWTGLGFLSQQVSYWGCIPSQTGMAAGTYTDAFTLTANWGQGQSADSAVGTAQVTIYAPANCTMSMPPGNMLFTYVAFGPQQNPTKTFTTTCTNTMPYSLALSPSSAVLVGLNYSLALNTSIATGTGFPQTFTITGTMAAGQAGECPTATCTGTQAHTVTVTY